MTIAKKIIIENDLVEENLFLNRKNVISSAFAISKRCVQVNVLLLKANNLCTTEVITRS